MCGIPSGKYLSDRGLNGKRHTLNGQDSVRFAIAVANWKQPKRTDFAVATIEATGYEWPGFRSFSQIQLRNDGIQSTLESCFVATNKNIVLRGNSIWEKASLSDRLNGSDYEWPGFRSFRNCNCELNWLWIQSTLEWILWLHQTPCERAERGKPERIGWLISLPCHRSRAHPPTHLPLSGILDGCAFSILL